MTPAEELRTAADAIHRLLDRPRLTPGPWQSIDGGDRLIRIPIPADTSRTEYVVDEPIENAANAEYIAAMHPGVGAALADWLAAHAVHLAASTHPGWQETTAGLPLAVARQILGSRP